MLQRGLSNRPTGVVAMLLLGAGYVLNFIRTPDHQDFLLRSLFGAPAKDAMVFIQRTGARVDHVLISWGEMLETESERLGCSKRRCLTAQRSCATRGPAFDASNFVYLPEAKAGASPCPISKSKSSQHFCQHSRTSTLF